MERDGERLEKWWRRMVKGGREETVEGGGEETLWRAVEKDIEGYAM